VLDGIILIHRSYQYTTEWTQTILIWNVFIVTAARISDLTEIHLCFVSLPLASLYDYCWLSAVVSVFTTTVTNFFSSWFFSFLRSIARLDSCGLLQIICECLFTPAVGFLEWGNCRHHWGSLILLTRLWLGPFFFSLVEDFEICIVTSGRCGLVQVGRKAWTTQSLEWYRTSATSVIGISMLDFCHACSLYSD
jgi:hypothetical protein